MTNTTESTIISWMVVDWRCIQWTQWAWADDTYKTNFVKKLKIPEFHDHIWNQTFLLSKTNRLVGVRTDFAKLGQIEFPYTHFLGPVLGLLLTCYLSFVTSILVAKKDDVVAISVSYKIPSRLFSLEIQTLKVKHARTLKSLNMTHLTHTWHYFESRWLHLLFSSSFFFRDASWIWFQWIKFINNEGYTSQNTLWDIHSVNLYHSNSSFFHYKLNDFCNKNPMKLIHFGLYTLLEVCTSEMMWTFAIVWDLCTFYRRKMAEGSSRGFRWQSRRKIATFS